jgi:hypothetical protein
MSEQEDDRLLQLQDADMALKLSVTVLTVFDLLSVCDAILVETQVDVVD